MAHYVFVYLETRLGCKAGQEVVPELFLETRLGWVVPELFLETRLGCKAGQGVVTRTVPGDKARV